MTSQEPSAKRASSNPQPAPAVPRRHMYQTMICGSMVVGGLGLMFTGTYLRQHHQLVRELLPEFEDAPFGPRQQAAAAVVVLLGCFTTCFGMVIGARALRRRSAPSRRRRTSQPAPSSERPFRDRLERYLDEGPTAANSGREGGGSMAFFSAVVPSVRHRPKSPGVIRRILVHLHCLLGGQR